MPNPEERPDLYDDWDGQTYQPLSAQYLMSVTPDNIKAGLEAKQGRPYSEIAKEMERESFKKALIYHLRSDGALYRHLRSRPVERFDQSTGRFVACELSRDDVVRTMPMRFAEARRLMRAAPLPDPADPNCG